MLNIISIVTGLIAFVFMLVGLFPVLGWLQWFAIVGGVVGIIFGALSDKKSGFKISTAILAVAILRTVIGGGVL